MKLTQHTVTNIFLAGIFTCVLTASNLFEGENGSKDADFSINENTEVLEQNSPDIGDNTPDPISLALQEKLKTLEQEKEKVDNAVVTSHDNSVVARSVNSGTTEEGKSSKEDLSCYVNNGNFSQPKFSYDKECNKLGKEQAERKIALALSKLPVQMLVSFEAQKEEKEILYVVTDYTCPYCQKLDKKLDEFTNAGYTVKYIFYPRALDYGRDYVNQARDVVDNMTNAFCAEDQVAGVKGLYKNKEAPFSDCSTIEGRINAPIREHYMLAHLLEVEYTPAVFTSSGKLDYGFRSVSNTLRNLGLR